MDTSPTSTSPRFLDGFATWEKMLWRADGLGLVVVALAGIHSVSPAGALGYALFAAVGLVVGLPSLCSHCPYPTRHSDCLFLPPKLVARLLPYRGPKLTRLEALAVLGVTVGFFLLPQIWLIQRPLWLVPFWALALPMAVGFPVHYCRRCRHVGCPMNRVPSRAPSAASGPPS